MAKRKRPCRIDSTVRFPALAEQEVGMSMLREKDGARKPKKAWMAGAAVVGAVL